jgi:predicted enzyme related to lactoylglutathione lyase
MQHQIVHFEIPADDVERARSFYAELFGWQFSNSPGYPDYWMVGGEGMNHGIGLMARQNPGHVQTHYFSVESVADYQARAERLGAKVLMPKSPVPGMGWFAMCQDAEGNVFGLWQEDRAAA